MIRRLVMISMTLAIAPAPPAVAQDDAPDPARIASQRATAQAAFDEGRFDEAAAAWAELRTMLPGTPEIPFNQALAVLKAEGENATESARGLFGDALDRATDPTFRATIAFNLGVLSQTVGSDIELPDEMEEDDRIAALESVESSLLDALGWYRESLAVDPAFDDARVNGELTWQRIVEVRAALLGACCVCAETCVQVRKQACADANGIWKGLVTACDACEPVGACCLLDGCEEATEVCCRDLEGEWLGPDSDCEQCFAPCCLPDRTCESMTRLGCEAQDGVRREGGDCEQCTVACCLLDGTCEERWVTDCEQAGGYPAQECTQCEEPSACCFEDGTCENLNFAECAEREGLWLALPARECSECDIGPCCLDDGTCDRISSDECENLNGRWLGPLRECEECESQDQQDEEQQDEEQQDQDQQEPQDEDQQNQDQQEQDQQEQNQDQQEPQDEDQQDPDQQDQDQQDQDQQDQDQQEQEQQEQDPSQQAPDEENPDEPQGQEQRRMTRSEALRLLQAVRDRERMRLEQMEVRERARYEKPEKDW